ncbi:hypothetical protein EVJ58_g7104, partial [Rhodofomes roseus]
MVGFLRTLVGASALSVAWSKPLARRALQLHEARAMAPTDYTLSSSASPDTVLNLRIALVQNNVDGLIDTLYDVSDPESSNYGQYLSKEEVEAYVKPTEESADAMKAWLSENELVATPLSPSGDWISVDIPVNKANDMLDADFSVFTHKVTGAQTVRTLQYSIPVDLAPHVDLIHPTVTFPVEVVNKAVPALAAVPNPYSQAVAPDANITAVCGPYNLPNITTACLQYLYGIPTTPATASGNGILVAGYVEEYANADDLKIFLERYRPDVDPSTTFATEMIDGGDNLQNVTAGSEGNLDIQYTVGLATDVPVTYLLAGEDTHDGLSGFLDTANYVLNQTSIPPVMTTSYSSNEDVISEKLAYNLCNAYAQLSARGVSIFFSSGDGGVSGTGFQDCTTSCLPSRTPAHSADINWADQGGVPFSSGGFSNYFPTPAFQSSAVAASSRNSAATTR